MFINHHLVKIMYHKSALLSCKASDNVDRAQGTAPSYATSLQMLQAFSYPGEAPHDLAVEVQAAYGIRTEYGDSFL